MIRTSTSTTFSVLIFSLITSGQAHALTFCANNATELRSAFSLAGSNGLDDEIRIRNVAMPASGFMASASTYLANIGDGKDVHISGGWTNNNCTDQVNDPKATVLMPAVDRRLIQVQNSASGTPFAPEVTIENLTLEGAGATPQLVGCAAKASGQMRFSLLRTIVAEFECGTATISTETWGPSVEIKGNLFISNTANNATVFRDYVPGNGQLPSSLLFSNNTLVGNTTNAGGELVRIDASSIIRFQNNALWDNSYPSAIEQPNELDMQIGNIIRHNLLQYPPTGPAIGNGNFSADPRFVSLVDLRPSISSPLRNAGDGQVAGGTTSVDLAGIDRVQENVIDIGAYEYDPNLIFSSDFD